jgi:hypothetical protein
MSASTYEQQDRLLLDHETMVLNSAYCWTRYVTHPALRVPKAPTDLSHITPASASMLALLTSAIDALPQMRR